MKKIFLIVTVLSLTAFAANAQKYGFYGNGAAKTQRTSYHNGVSGVYVGYHPAGVSNSHVTGSTQSNRSGFSKQASPAYMASPAYNNGISVINNGNSRVVSKSQATVRRSNYSASSTAASAEGYNPMQSKKSNGSGLGISSAISTFSVSGSGSGSGSGSTGVTYGRTSSSSGSSTSFGVTMSAMPKQMANTTNNNNQDGDTPSFTDLVDVGPSNYSGDGPIGDAILPLLLLLIPVVVLKVRKH